ncbi:MAG TPA: hypothetical protein VJ386_09095 [Candidatus Deferrimicrobiaceae bacterium]|nr:hypothetical protein [Candidatus Deferrimicrobiaceae bacterium]
MTTRTEKEEVRFSFDVSSDFSLKEEGQCDLCYGHFLSPGVDTMLRGFLVCPYCVLTGPKYAALNVEETANDKERLAQRDENPIDQQDIKTEYLILAEGLRSLKFFNEIPGGITARHLAAASLELRDAKKALARRRKRGTRKAA